MRRGMKVECTSSEMSAEIQRAAFSLGFTWRCGSSEVKHTEYRHLYFGLDNMDISMGDSPDVFEEDDGIEVEL